MGNCFYFTFFLFAKHCVLFAIIKKLSLMTHHETTEEPIRRRRIVEPRLRRLYKVGLVELWAGGSR